MALVSNGFWADVAFEDFKGTTTHRRLQLNVADFAGAQVATANYIAAVEELTDAVVVGYAIQQRFVENAFVAPTEGSNWDVMLLTVGIDGNPTKSATISVPAPATNSTDGLLWAGTSGDDRKVVNGANQDVVDFLALFGAAGSIYVSDGEVGAGLKRGRLRQGRRTLD